MHDPTPSNRLATAATRLGFIVVFALIAGLVVIYGFGHSWQTFASVLSDAYHHHHRAYRHGLTT